VGPSLGGIMVQLVTAPIAILADAISFVCLAAVLRSIRDLEPPRARAEPDSLLREVREGMAALLGHPVLRSITVTTTLVNLTIALVTPILILYMVRTLHLSPAVVGVVLMVYGMGGVLGALAGGAMAGRLPVHATLGLGLLLCASGSLLIAAAAGPMLLTLAVLVTGMAAFGFGVPFFNVNQLSLRQSVTPARLQARVHATSRTLTWGALPLGAFVGGLLGEHLGLRPTLAISGAGTLAAAAIAYLGVLIATRRRRPD